MAIEVQGQLVKIAGVVCGALKWVQTPIALNAIGKILKLVQ